jgi:hypothetical protein
VDFGSNCVSFRLRELILREARVDVSFFGFWPMDLGSICWNLLREYSVSNACEIDA